MTRDTHPVAIVAEELPERPKPHFGPFMGRLNARQKRVLGDVFGLTNFGVNLTRLPPGAISALRHAHTRQDELVYILEGEATLVTNAGETRERQRTQRRAGGRKQKADRGRFEDMTPWGMPPHAGERVGGEHRRGDIDRDDAPPVLSRVGHRTRLKPTSFPAGRKAPRW